MHFQDYFFWFLATAFSLFIFRPRSSQQSFYKKLKKPFFAPPAWLFGVVWTCLWVTMSTASSLAQREMDGWEFPLTIYMVYLGVSMLFTPLFFHYKALWTTAIQCFIALALAIVVTAFYFKYSVVAGWLFVLTPTWLVYATVLSVYIAICNKPRK